MFLFLSYNLEITFNSNISYSWHWNTKSQDMNTNQEQFVRKWKICVFQILPWFLCFNIYLLQIKILVK